MSILMVGISHHSAPVAVLERVAAATGGGSAAANANAAKVVSTAADSPYVAETVLLATCNRVELYADVERFHGAVEQLSTLLAAQAGVPMEELTPHLVVRYEDGAVSHLFSVACGLDAMVVGESQILGQVKDALRRAQDAETIGPVLNGLFQQALRVGKRAQAETDVGRAGQSLVTVALERAQRVLGELRGRRVVIVGAGSLAALAATVVHRDHGARITVVNRTPSRAERLAAGVAGTAVPWEDLAAALTDADVVLTCTGAVGTVVSSDMLAAALDAAPEPRQLVVLDLALPHDVDQAAADLDGVHLVDLASLADRLHGAHGADVEAVREIVAADVRLFAASRRAAAVTPTVVALRDMAAGVVGAELTRLRTRLPELEARHWDEVEKAVRRVAGKLLHVPTTRLKELSQRGGEMSYAEAVRELFALDPATIDTVSRPDIPDGTGPDTSSSPSGGGAP